MSINIVMFSPNCEENYIMYISTDYSKCEQFFIEQYEIKYESRDMYILKDIKLEEQLDYLN